MKVNGLAHIGIPTGDMAATRTFYQEIGFDVVFEMKNDDGEIRVTFLKCGNVMLETYVTDSPALKAGAINHVALDVEDIEAAYETAKARGYKMLDSEIRFLPFFENGTRFFNVEGPNSEIVEFSVVL